LIEWDENIPPWDVLAAEASTARAIRSEALGPEREAGTWATAL
jgi:uncharacterized protein (UPF0276 family)